MDILCLVVERGMDLSSPLSVVNTHVGGFLGIDVRLGRGCMGFAPVCVVSGSPRKRRRVATAKSNAGKGDVAIDAKGVATCRHDQGRTAVDHVVDVLLLLLDGCGGRQGQPSAQPGSPRGHGRAGIRERFHLGADPKRVVRAHARRYRRRRGQRGVWHQQPHRNFESRSLQDPHCLPTWTKSCLLGMDHWKGYGGDRWTLRLQQGSRWVRKANLRGLRRGEPLSRRQQHLQRSEMGHHTGVDREWPRGRVQPLQQRWSSHKSG